jgi:protein LTV1
VVHRSQRDPKANDPEASKYVLLSSSQHVELRSDSESDDEHEEDSDLDDSDDEMPDLIDAPAKQKSSAKPPKKKSSKPAFPVRKVRFGGVEAEDLVDENGMVRDGYDYSQHMKEMGHGKFYSATSRFDAGEEARALSRKVDLPEDALPSTEEQDRLLDAITLTTDVMDGDLREALVNDEAFEELDDNFVVQAAEANADDAGADDFDYDAHIAKLMEAASGVTPLHRGNITDSEGEDFSEDEDEFSDDEGAREEEEEGELPEDRDEAQRVLDELFEKTLAEEYDDEQLGELEEDDPETRGKETLDGELLAAVVEDYAFVQQELADAEGKLGNALREGNNLQKVLDECAAERHAYEYDEDADTEDEEEPEDPAARAEREKKELQELYERNQYLRREEREQWDCETIVSTYSTLDNHPTVLREEGPTRRKKKKQPAVASIAEGGDLRKQKVTLSRKTGMPLGVFETETSAKASKHKEQQPEPTRRQKGETKEEKRARKAAVKMDKMARRAEKKETKLLFKEEEARQSTQTVAGRVSVFKY